MINALTEQDKEDIQEPSWMKWLAFALAFSIVFLFMIMTAFACSGVDKKATGKMDKPVSPVTTACKSCAQVRKNVQTTLPGTTIGEIRKSPSMKGIYEIQMGKTIAYTNKSGHFFIVGHMYDPAHNLDLTAARLADLNRVQWKDLPMKDAIVSGPKDGVKLAIFTDPECPYCRHLETILKGMKGIRTYTFLFPLESIHPQALSMAKSIWCAKDQKKALLDIMLDGKTLPPGTCDTSVIARNIQLARKLGINGTPGLISGTGRSSAGAPQSASALREWLALK